MRLTTDGKMKMDPVFVQGGAALVYTVQETPIQMSLMRLKLADGSTERLHPEAMTNEFEAAFSPDGRYCAFVQSKGNLNLRLVIQDTMQNKEATFDPGGGFAGMRRPTIAPDASRVVFSIPAANGQQLHSLNIQAQDRKTLTTTSINHWPAFAPDGKKLAFGSSRDGNFEIYVTKADGSEPIRLTRTSCMNMRPTWSPDGKRIAFTSNRDGKYEIYVMGADGANARRVTDHPERDDYPAWHPDGKRLVFVAERGGRFDLELIEIRE